MNDTYGPNFTDSSASANLQRALASRLRARMADYGSPGYKLTWKNWDMPSGPPICALRASVRRTSGKGYSGWQTPKLPSGGACERHSAGGGLRKLEDQAELLVTGWPTPRTPTGGPESAQRKQELGRTKSGGGDLQAVVQMAGWPTPCQQDGPHGEPNQGMDRLPTAVQTVGVTVGLTPDSSNAPMESKDGYRLNPFFSLWLMNFPVYWGLAAILAYLKR